MHEITNNNIKTNNQAWRKKPRKFAPKSKLGCKTCKIRRIKCDLTQPSCSRCSSTGRTCDGYGESLPASKSDSADNTKSSGDHGLGTIINAYQSGKWHPKTNGLILRGLEPLMVLPVVGSAQGEAMGFFEQVSIMHLNQYQLCGSWRETLMYFSQTVPAVRHAAMALALIHRQYVDRVSSHHVHQLQSSDGWGPGKAPLTLYNKAIQLLLNGQSGDSAQTTAVTLLVCYLFTSFDHLACNYTQALKHLRGGIELSRSIDKSINDEDSTYRESNVAGSRTLVRHVARQIRRLDMQAVMFTFDWNPVDIEESFMFQLPSCDSADSAFESLEQAADHIVLLSSRTAHVRNTEQGIFLMHQPPPSSSSLKVVISEQLATWSTLFENTLRRDSSYQTGSGTMFIPLLRLYYHMTSILLGCAVIGREMDYDAFLPQFQQCVALADEVAAAREPLSGSTGPTFTPEIGIIPVLYVLGVKCRHPMIRRKVVSILRRYPMREAVWDSISAARVVERVIEIEEDASGKEGTVREMQQIAEWQRVEIVSWRHVVSDPSANMMELSYTFCGQREMFNEPLII